MSEKLSEAIIEILIDHANAEEANAVNMKHQLAKLVGVKEAVAVKEETFTVLKFEKQRGNKIGEFEVAYKANNIPEKFQRAYNILEKNNATISNRYRGDGYIFTHWLYGKDKIYRQKMKSS